MKICKYLPTFLLLQLALVAVPGGPSWALGLEEIKVKAAYNKRFLAEITVLLDHKEDKVTASVGSPLDYSILQVSRPDFIDSFQVEVKQDPRNPKRKILVISSTATILQPSFNLVIRASSRGGTILEKYFLVMDFKKTLSLELPKEKKAEKKPEKPVKKVFMPKPAEKKPKLVEKLEEEEVKEAPLTIPIEPIAPMTITIKRGNSLFRIVQKLGFPKIFRPKIVLAIYLRNKKAFIKGNIHLLRVGAKLNLDKIEELANRLTFKEVNKILAGHMENIRPSPRPKPLPVTFELPVAEFIPAEEILAFLQQWKKHWMERDNANLAKDYASDFRDARGRGKSDFLASRIAFNSDKENIKITHENISIVRSGQSTSVYSTQWFRSDTFVSAGQKHLKIKKTTTGLKIAGEEFIPNRAISERHPWVVLIASSKNHEMVEKNIESLRDAGFEAFEAESFQNPEEKRFRILAGRSSTKMLAKILSREFKGVGKTSAKVIKLPFALEAATYANHGEAMASIEKLQKKGYSPYLLETAKNGNAVYRVYIGGFHSRKKAEKILEQIKDEEFKFRISTP